MTEGDHHRADREAAFVAIFDAYYPKVLAYTSRRLGRDAGAEAAADAFIGAWLRFGELEGDPLIWLYGLARGAVANHRRRIQRAHRLNDRARELSIAPRPVDPADEVTWRYAVSAALAQLREDDREILSLVAWEGLSPAEGAAVLGCSVGAFRVRLHRARRRFRRHLDADPVVDVTPIETRLPPRQRTDRRPRAQSELPPSFQEEYPCR